MRIIWGCRRAFTLIELMVALSIFIIVMGIAFTALRLNDIYRENVASQIELYRINKQAQDTIRDELSRSAWSKINAANSSVLTFQIPLVNLINDTYNIPWGADNTSGYWIRYSLNGTNLERVILTVGLTPAGSASIIADNINNLTFNATNATGTMVNISTTAQKITAERRLLNATLTQSVYLRNE